MIKRTLIVWMSSTILASCGTLLGTYKALDKSAAEHFNRPYGSPPQNFKPPAKKRKAGLIKPLKVKARLFSTPHQTCAIGPKGLGLYCWGSSFYGELGVKDRRISKPIKIKGLPKNDPVVDMVFMNRGACVLLRSGYVMCWGDNRMGTVGNQKRGFYPKPTYVQALEGAVKLSSYFGAKQVCAILHTGDLYCWGLRDMVTHYKPLKPYKKVFGLPQEIKIHKKPIRDISSRHSGSCFTTRLGKVKCVGRTVGYKLTNKVTKQATIDLPKRIKNMSVFNNLSLSCAVLNNHDLWCWNGCISDYYCYGNPNLHSAFRPIKIKVPKIRSINEVAVMQKSYCVLSKANKVYCWGHCRQLNACNTPKGFKAPKLKSLPGTPDKSSMNACLTLCDKRNRGKDELYCSLFCGTALKYYHRYLDSVKKGQPVVPAIQKSLSKYKFKTLTNSGLGFCGISKNNEVFCWGHNIASRKKNKKLLNIKKISKKWWK